MDVSQPILSVIPSLDGPVLAALAATSEPLTLTDVHRLTGRGSLTGVRRVLMRQVGAGIVETVGGRYALNRSHLAAPAIEALSCLHGELGRRIGAALDEWPAEILVAGIFGSTARRDGDDGSDVDVLVVSDSPDLDELTDDLARQIRDWTGNVAQVVGISASELRRLRATGEQIVKAWERDIVVLRGNRRAIRGAA